MMGQLTREQMENILHSEVTGRIGYQMDGRTYVMPVSYAYDGENVYAHSAPGLKIRAMRANPDVCFEVEQIDNLANWRCIIAWGKYEELTELEAERAHRRLADRFGPLITSESMQPISLPRTAEGDDENARRSIFYRIRLTEKTGRYEKR